MAPRTKIFVGKLPDDCSEGSLQKLFEQHGEVTECSVLGNYGFVHMKSEEEAKEAIDSLNNYEFMGTQINVEQSTGEKRGFRGRGRGGFRGGRGDWRGGRGRPMPYSRPPIDRYDDYDAYGPPPPRRDDYYDHYGPRSEMPRRHAPPHRDPYAMREPYDRYDPYSDRFPPPPRRSPPSYRRDPYDLYSRDPYSCEYERPPRYNAPSRRY